MVIAIAIIVAAAGLVVLAVMFISLGRQTIRLAGAVGDFQRAVRPVLDEIQRDAARAQSRADRLSQRRQGRAAVTSRRG
jgi:hypothetical protein